MNYKDQNLSFSQSEIENNHEITNLQSYMEMEQGHDESLPIMFKTAFKEHLDNLVLFYENSDKEGFESEVIHIKNLFNEDEMKYKNECHDVFLESDFPLWLIESLVKTLNLFNPNDPNALPIMSLVTLCNIVIVSSQNEDFLDMYLEKDYVLHLNSILHIQNLIGKSYLLVCFVNVFNGSPIGKNRHQDIYKLSNIQPIISEILSKRNESDNDDDYKFILYYLNYYIFHFNLDNIDEEIHIIRIIGQMISCEDQLFIVNLFEIYIQILDSYKSKPLPKSLCEAFILANIPHFTYHYFMYHNEQKVIRKAVTGLSCLNTFDLLNEHLGDITLTDEPIGDITLKDEVFNKCIERIRQSNIEVDENIVVNEEREKTLLKYAAFINNYIINLQDEKNHKKDLAKIAFLQENDIVGNLIDLLSLADHDVKVLIAKSIFNFLLEIEENDISKYLNENFFGFLQEALSYESPDLVIYILKFCNRACNFVYLNGIMPVQEILDLFDDPQEFNDFVVESLESDIDGISCNAFTLNSFFTQDE